ncbi:MAG: ATP-binding protein [Calditrichia bacterium]
MSKISSRTLLFTILTTVFTLIVIDLYTWNHTRTFLLNGIRQDLHEKAALSLGLIDDKALENRDRVRLKQFTDEIKNLTGMRTTLIGKQGEVLADSEIPIDELNNVENHLNRKELQQALRTGSGLAIRNSATIGQELLYYAEPIRENGRVIGFIRFALLYPEFRNRMAYVTGLIARINLFLIVVVIGAVLLYWNWLTRQMENLRTPLIGQKEAPDYQMLPDQKYEEMDRIKADINAIGEKLQIAREELVSDQQLLLNIFDSLDEGVAAFDFDGLPLLNNRSFIDILKLKDGADHTRPFYDWVHFPPLIQDIESYLEKREPIKRRLKYYGDSFIEYKILPLKFNPREDSGFLVTLRDVTQLQQLETIRQDFVANVSHEFKTPLTSIRGYAETLLSEMAEDRELRKKFLEKIVSRTEHLENLVTDLLQLSRIEKNEITTIDRINPIPDIQEVAEEFMHISRSRKMKFDFEIMDFEKDIFIRASANLLHTLLSNLIMNALQYNHPEGSVWLRIKVEHEYLRIEVQDTGVGFTKEQRERIFERFYRVEAARSSYVQGTGLGLSIVRHIVELLEGKIEVESEPGKGSLFRVEFPII